MKYVKRVVEDADPYDKQKAEITLCLVCFLMSIYFVPEIVSGTGICRIEKSIAYVEVPCAPGYLWVKWDK